MFDELIPMLGSVVDKLANTDEGHKLVDDLGSVVGRFYNKLVTVKGIPPELAAAICSSVGSSSGKK